MTCWCAQLTLLHVNCVSVFPIVRIYLSKHSLDFRHRFFNFHHSLVPFIEWAHTLVSYRVCFVVQRYSSVSYLHSFDAYLRHHSLCPTLHHALCTASVYITIHRQWLTRNANRLMASQKGTGNWQIYGMTVMESSFHLLLPFGHKCLN